MSGDILLREVRDDDLATFFEQQLDPTAQHMAAFTAKDPADQDAFLAHWRTIRGDHSITNRTILVQGQVAGHIGCFERLGEPEVTYWLGRDFWGQGIATRALATFLPLVTVRPLYARVVKDNVASRRVLEKCGFTVTGEDKGFANARGAEVEEYILTLGAGKSDSAQ